LGAAAAADVAGLVTIAVNIARKRDINPLLDPPTPESVAAVARHFAAVGVARAGGTVPAGAAVYALRHGLDAAAMVTGVASGPGGSMPGGDRSAGPAGVGSPRR
jgi:hypothetical protein